MIYVLIAAAMVGGATVLGVVIGFRFERISVKMNNRILSLGAGVMLAAAILGLVLPSMENGGILSLGITIAGIFTGALALSQLERLIPKLRQKWHKKTGAFNRGLLFVFAIAIHNLPEGIAAGVGFGGKELSQAMMIAASIALQNIPEGMVIITPMIRAGIHRKRALLYALGTALIEIIGTFIGYTAVHLSTSVLPFALAFAGGTMLYVIIDEMIPQTHSDFEKRDATYAALIGFCLMLVFDTLF